MADPTPSRGLPEKEYVEIFNSTNRSIRLKEYVLSYGKFRVNLPDSLLSPNEYATLVRKGNENEFLNFQKVIVLSQLSLNNSGETLAISKNNQVVNSVSYSDKWYAKGKEQGYSLEMIDLNYPCAEALNWTSSSSTLGGTPSQKNASSATNPDLIAPKFLFLEQLSSTQLQLTFDEKLDSIQVKNPTNFSFSDDTKATTISTLLGNKSILVNLNKPIPSVGLIDLTIKNITDCSGNVASDFTVQVGSLPPAEIGDIVLNELLFNPKLGGGDYVEIINTSEKSVSLKNWEIANADENGVLKDKVPITSNNLIIKPQQILVFTEKADFLTDFYPKNDIQNTYIVSKLPSFVNTNGVVFLLNDKGIIFDKFVYDEQLHHPMIDNPDGVSLEKINYTILSESQSNWQSAAADVNFGTPGTSNSQGNATEVIQNFTIEPEVFTPNNDGFKDFTTLSYNFETSGNAASITIFNTTGMPVKQLIVNSLLSTNGSINWDGTDNSGNILPMGYYLILIDVFNPNGDSFRKKMKVVLGQNN